MPASEPTSRVTIQTIADRAGVHKSTVSRAMNPGASGARVGPDVIARIQAIAAELGYRPDPNAASLRSRRSQAIGVLVPRLTDVVLATIFEGVEEFAARSGYQAVVANTLDDAEERRHRLDMLLSRRVDGLILADAHLDDDSLLRAAEAASIPFVLVNRSAPGFVSVTCADRAGGRLVGEHLAAAGHERIAIVGGHRWASTAVNRAAGCREALAASDIDVREDHLVFSGFDIGGGRAAAVQVLDTDQPPTAIFAVNDYAAIGVMGALRDRGMQAGRDVAVAGFNDIDLAVQLPITLTSVDSHPWRMGQLAAEQLLTALRGEEHRSMELDPVLHVRESTTG